MKKMDEMERNIQLRSEEIGYKTMLLAMAAWVLFNCWQSLANGTEYEPLPVLILCLATSVQFFSQTAIRQKMIAGDDEYREPNRLLQMILLTVIFLIILLSVGTYLAVTL